MELYCTKLSDQSAILHTLLLWQCIPQQVIYGRDQYMLATHSSKESVGQLYLCRTQTGVGGEVCVCSVVMVIVVCVVGGWGVSV